ncbi:ABC transporter substrate-binding protein [Glycomyces algeriensis]|uniref:Sugar ABC transporter substrate-binding protein n=1 Tax=Glycomyces algeriensis TaxID=256037 RepID=A0A9W6G739_9ACTN|nr:extracellular solute-binding protein [Glycomyces algeriensis]MDA1365281.1 extracellular solute-binding protein [Glycomyces algeriensis]MDR7349655.1 multiple sugar transport system substrate-binding protein [Glycomyces algeriensis]GLI42365.1 sugar ABC transporter substrate-binding protein [Glycomyces algeriensis]
MQSSNPSGVSRRTLAKAGIFGAATAPLLAACGNDGGGGAAEGDGELDFWWWGSDPRHEYTQKIVDAFLAQNDGVTIKPSPNEFDAYWDALNVSVSGNNAPDVLQQDERYLRDYADKNALLALDDIGIDLSNIEESTLKTGQLDGKTYGIGTGVNAMALLVNPALVEAAGMAMPDDTTWSWADFSQFITDLSAQGDAIGNSAISFSNESLFNIFARQKGESLYTADGKLGFTEATMNEWWQMVLDLRDSGAIPEPSKIVEAFSAGQDQAPLATGTGVTEFYWTNQIGAIQKVLGGDLVLLRVPGESTGVQPGLYLKSAMYWSISRTTSDQAAAAKLVDFLLNSDESLDLMLGDRGVPSNTAQRERILPNLPPDQKLGADFIATITPELAEGPPVPPVGSGSAADIMLGVFETMIFGDVSVEDSTKSFMDQLNAEIGA